MDKLEQLLINRANLTCVRWSAQAKLLRYITVHKKAFKGVEKIEIARSTRMPLSELDFMLRALCTLGFIEKIGGRFRMRKDIDRQEIS